MIDTLGRMTGSVPLGLPSTVTDALSGIPGEAGSHLGDPDTAIQQNLDLRYQQITLCRGKILQGAGAQQAVDAVDVAPCRGLSIVGPLPQDRLKAAGKDTTDLHQDIQVLLSMSGGFLRCLE